MNRLIAVLLLVVPVNGSAQDASPDKVYWKRIEQARASYRVAIAKEIRQARKVEVLLLRFDDLREVDLLDAEEEEERFPVDPYEATTRVISKKVLTPAQSKELLLALAKQIEKPRHTGGYLCHYPVHGVRIYSGEPGGKPVDDELIYSGTFCWVCENFGFTYPDESEWLNANGDLKRIFNKLLPIPKEELERFKKKYPTKRKGDKGNAPEQPGGPDK